MSILKKIFSSKDNTTITHQKTSRIAISGLTEIGNVNPVCPSCNFELDEKPERKKKCPHCGNNIFVRTRPLDRKKVLISDKQIDQLDFQWQLYNEHKERENYEQDPEYLKVRDELRKKFKREPSVSDVRWGLANLKVIEHANNNDWGLYRNAKHEMAKILEKEERIKESLIIYLEVFFLDINGAMNRGNLSPELAAKYPPLDPKQSFVAPGIINTIIDFSKKQNLDSKEIESLFIEAAKSEYNKSLMPFDPTEGLKELLEHFTK